MKRPARSPKARPTRRGQAQSPASQRRRMTWLRGVQFSTFSLVMAGILAVGVLSLVPRLQQIAEQQAQISALKAQNQVSKAELEAIRAEAENWTDPAFVATQARARLYYVKPGEVSYLVINDLPAGALTLPDQTVSSTLQTSSTDWLGSLVSSFWAAGQRQQIQAPPAPSGSAPAVTK